MAGISTARKFWVAIGIIFLALILTTLALMGIMYMRPNTVILGFTYAKYIDAKAYIYTEDTDISTDDIQSVYIESERSNIFICPLDNDVYPLTKDDSTITFEDDVIVVHQVMKYEGYSYAYVGRPTYEAYINQGTLHIKTTEPHHFASNPDTYVSIFLPKGMSFSSVTAVSKYGKVTVDTINTVASVEVESMTLQTLSTGSIFIRNIGDVKDFYLKTYKGNVNFENKNLNCRKVEFESTSGALLLHNSEWTSRLEVTDSLNIRSRGKCQVVADSILGDINILGNGGDYIFNRIGAIGAESRVIATTNYMNLTIKDILVGYVSIVKESENCKNNVKIHSLLSSIDTSSVIHVGKGYADIEEVNSNVAVESSSGYIKLNKINPNKSVYAYSTSGSIYVGYLESSTRHNEVNTTIITDTGSIKAENISGILYIEVKKDSAKKILDVIMTAVTQSDDLNVIKARDRQVNVTIRGLSDSLLCKLFTTCQANSMTSIMQRVNSGDLDDELDIYTSFAYQYRVAYTSPIPSISNMAGRLFVTASGVTVYEDN